MFSALRFVPFFLLLIHVFALSGEKPYLKMDFGPSLNWTYQIEKNFIVYKGTAVQVDGGSGGLSKAKAWMLFDHDTLSMSAGWVQAEGKPAFIDWKGVAFDGSHGTHASISGRVVFSTLQGPGYANPSNESWDDPRYQSPVDKKRYGPIPRAWGGLRGVYRHGHRVIFSYSIGSASVLEMPGFDASSGAFTRTLEVESAKHALTLRVAAVSASVALAGQSDEVLSREGGEWRLKIPASATKRRIALLIGEGTNDKIQGAAKLLRPETLDALTKGGPQVWKEKVETTIAAGEAKAGFVSETLTLPDNNPWDSWLRPGGFDFLPDSKSAAVCTWDGDVWLASGVDGAVGGKIVWSRIASGLFQPLGLKFVNGKMYVSCRDQIVRLNDLNGDGETDFYETFNNDHQVTEHFHEFAMGLQTDAKGNFYYAKSARHAKPALIPQHGTLMRVSPDGQKSEIVASGFRAANGVCVNNDGTFYVTDQEGHWTPKNRINLVKEGGFYGNMMGWVSKDQSPDDSAMSQPLVWITNAKDRSPGELVKVESPSWGDLNGVLLNTSYGTGKVFVVLREPSGAGQGGVVELPLRFPTGVMRGRFHSNGDFYTCGLFSWSGSATKPGGFYRIRCTGPVEVPVSLSVTRKGIVIGFAQALDRESATNASAYNVRVWGLKRTGAYGSKHMDERTLEVKSVELLPDGKSVRIQIPALAPTWCMSIQMGIKTASGTPLNFEIHNTVQVLGE